MKFCYWVGVRREVLLLSGVGREVLLLGGVGRKVLFCDCSFRCCLQGVESDGYQVTGCVIFLIFKTLLFFIIAYMFGSRCSISCHDNYVYKYEYGIGEGVGRRCFRKDSIVHTFQ